MKATYNWLKDFVDIRISPQKLADKLTMAGLEVKSIEEREGDFIFELEVTSNRPDCLSVIGIAGEVAAITNKKLKKAPATIHQPSEKTDNGQTLIVKIEDAKACPFYTAKIIKNVKVRPSPEWLKKRLEFIGCRSVNNVVDITNYVLFTYGEPLHAFDLDKLISHQPSAISHQLNIIVRRSKIGEEIITIDGIKRTLDENILIIASQPGKPIAIAGIMGGEDTEVTENTKNILLEAAVFNPVIIRRARQKLGIQTDSSYRFERAVVAESALTASLEAVKLIKTVTAGDYVFARSYGQAKTKKKIVRLNILDVFRVLGVKINKQGIKNILSNLGFIVKQSKAFVLSVEVPAYRQDIKLDIDLIEEICRIFGYENIPKTLPAFYPHPDIFDTREPVNIIKNMLIGLGLTEVITYSLVDRTILEGWENRFVQPIEMSNPLSKEQEVLRPSIIPCLLKCVASNLNQKQEKICIFEIADVFSFFQGKTVKEERVLSIALCGVRSLLFEQGSIREHLGILHLKGIIEMLLKRLGVKVYSFESDGSSGIQVLVNEKIIGTMELTQKNILENFGIEDKAVSVLELRLDEILPYVDLEKKFTPLAVYPEMSRDISLLIKEDIKIADVLPLIKTAAASEVLREIKVIDYYKGRQIPSGFKALTVSCRYGCGERTLTEEEINPIHFSIVEALADKPGIKIR